MLAQVYSFNFLCLSWSSDLAERASENYAIPPMRVAQ